jgi:dual-specificity kinase
VRAFGRQLLEAVAYLHEVQLVHTDLKPENILLASLEYSKLEPPSAARRGRAAARRVPCGDQIRVIDFGSATFEDQYHSSIVSTRHYRAPEVILGLGWSFPCDLWSVGCILVELATGARAPPPRAPPARSRGPALQAAGRRAHTCQRLGALARARGTRAARGAAR